MKKLLVAAMALTTATTAFADLGPTRTQTGAVAVEAGKNFRLEGDVGFSVNQTKNDTSKTTKENLNANLLFQRQQGVWGQEVRAQAISSNDDASTTNTEQYYLSGKVLHRSSPTVYQFAQLAGEKDLGSAFDYQATATAGLGMDILKDSRQSLTAEIGAGYRHSKERYAPHDKHNEAIGTVAAFYEYQINPTVRFNQDLGYEFGKDSRTLRSRTSLSADLTDRIAGVASYSIKDISADSGDSRISLASFGIRYKH
ncbi:DUF481 domain-containing protein [Moraxella nasicaprae]|uniref:DUF481 domain-containing protein n=1 Tax=Moraxella nasicaprae TaxID=2904122 RepID=A0ABY6F4H1_9GAMM|nr:DUF481 domain-containing protein [Moraxella nasicaprae]UXZ04939.1 DUF481 domain-containing protein [Moraxella nasicaprae]